MTDTYSILLSNTTITLLVGVSYFLGAVLYRIAPEEVIPFLKKHPKLNLFGMHFVKKSFVVGAIFGIILYMQNIRVISAKTLVLFVLIMIASSIASKNKTLKKATIDLIKPYLIFASFSIFVSSALLLL